MSREKSKRQKQKSGSARHGRIHRRLSIFIALISFSGAMSLNTADRNGFHRRSVKSDHTSALWISTWRRRRNHARGLRRDDYNANRSAQSKKRYRGMLSCAFFDQRPSSPLF
jgi:hypothetical protein